MFWEVDVGTIINNVLKIGTDKETIRLTVVQSNVNKEAFRISALKREVDFIKRRDNLLTLEQSSKAPVLKQHAPIITDLDKVTAAGTSQVKDANATACALFIGKTKTVRGQHVGTNWVINIKIQGTLKLGTGVKCCPETGKNAHEALRVVTQYFAHLKSGESKGDWS